MAAFLEWQMDIETWRGSVESRLEGLEAITDLIPDILDKSKIPGHLLQQHLTS